MTQPQKQVADRIKTVKNNLDSAEQSFLDNKSIRGELDLMLAEAELKNLRRKRFLPWSWNRQVLAACIAAIVAVAGMGGWFIAKDRYSKRNRPRAVEMQTATLPAEQGGKKEAEGQTQALNGGNSTDTKQVINSSNQDTDVNINQKTNENTASANAAASERISREDMHKLVRSARVELSNSH